MGCAHVKDSKKKSPGCKNNGGCQTGGCNKLNVFDWLSDMEVATSNSFNIVEVRFKNGRKDFFKNVNNLDLTTGEAVVVEMQFGYHIGYISLKGELVRFQMKKKEIVEDTEIKNIIRKPSVEEIEDFNQFAEQEQTTLLMARELIRKLGLEMKLSNIEFQADRTKAIFFYSSDHRVDFRELIKLLSHEFNIRVEMRQVTLRSEASILGGIGDCGRELCCSTWLSNLKNVATVAARYQNLSLNSSKITGQCGRLKCCLNYELDTYIEGLKDFPKIKKPLLTGKGEAYLQKSDIFGKKMWFSYKDEITWHAIHIDRVHEIMKLNRAGKVPANLELDTLEERENIDSLNNDLERLDNKFSGNKEGRKNR